MKKLVLALLVMFSVGAAVAQTKIGHVDTQKLLDTMPSRKVVEAELAKFEKTGTDELQEMYTDLQAAVAKFQNERPSMAPVMIKIEEEKLARKEQAIQDRNQALQQELQMVSESLQLPLFERIQAAVKIVAQRKKLNYVLNYQEFAMIMYTDGLTDITNEVIVELLILDAAAMKK
jgi:outer membrane protein